MATKKKTAEELTIEQTETETVEEIVDTLDTVEEAPVKTDIHIVTYGETWVSISELYRGTASNNSYAKQLKQANGNKHLTSGTVLTLP